MTVSTNQYDPDYAVPPGWVLEEHIEALGLSQEEFAVRCRFSPEFVSEIVAGKGIIDPETASVFGRETGLNEGLWLRMESSYRDKLSELGRDKDLAEWAKKFPVKELVKRGAISERSLQADKLARMLSFFDVWSVGTFDEKYGEASAAYWHSPIFSSSRLALAAWLRLGEIQAERTECPKYVKAKFRKSLNRIRELTGSQPSPSELLEEAQGLFLDSGVVLLYIDTLSDAAAGSAAWWLPEDKFMGIPTKPVVQLSAQHKTDASLWYGLFHTAAHILLHDKRRVFVDTIPEHAVRDEASEGDAEDQADAWAQDFLIPRAEWDKFAGAFSGGTAGVQQFAKEQGISPGIVVGRLQREGQLPWGSRLNELKRKLEWTGPSV